MKSRTWQWAGVVWLCAIVIAPAGADERSDELRGSAPQRSQQPPRQPPQSPPQQRPQPSYQNPQPTFQRPPQVAPQRPSNNTVETSRPAPQANDELRGALQSRPEVRQSQPPRQGYYEDIPRRPGYAPPGWQQGPGRGPDYGGRPQYRPGQIVDRFPDRYDRVPWGGQDYYYSGGYWYRPQGQRYQVVVPPYGARVRTLPSYAERMWIGSTVFFSAAGTYYQWQDNTQDYVVVNPPQGNTQVQVIETAPRSGEGAGSVGTSSNYDVAAWPANGQSPEQIQQDQYTCRRWAAEQTGFNPASATYAPAPEVIDLYRRNLANCLGSRGYSVN